MRRQIEDAKPADVDAVAALVAFDVTDTGDILVTDNGIRRVGRADGFNMSITERLEELKSERPELFGGKASKSSADPSNPFASGPNHNVTAQMMMWRTDPERAEHLSAEAGFKLSRSR